MKALYLIGVALIISCVSAEYNESAVNLKNYNNYQPKTCRLTFGEICFQSSECCNSLICSPTSYICDCPYGFTWSTEFKKCFRCPAGWVFFGSSCYLISQETKTWDQANSECARLNATLASFSSDVIVDSLNRFFTLNSLTGSFAVGASTNRVPGNWSWADGTCIPFVGPWWSPCSTPVDANFDTRLISLGCATATSTGLTAVDCSIGTPTRYICQLNTQNSRRYGSNYNNYNRNSYYATPRCPSNFKWSEVQRKCVSCPDDWVFANDKCYFVSSSTMTKTWTEARDYCANSKSTLLVVKTDTIIDELSELFYVASIPSKTNLWIGAYGSAIAWTWLDSRLIPATGPWWKTTGTTAATCLTQIPAVTDCVAAYAYSIKNFACTEAKQFICQLN